MRLDANASWFMIRLNGNTNFKVYAFSGNETVHAPYEFHVELVTTSPDEDLSSYLGKAASLTIADVSGAKRYVHGLVREMEQLHTANTFTHYSCVIVPKLWFLAQKSDHRIFQNMTVRDIIEKVLQEQGIAGDAVDFKLSKDYEQREYCVQYGETSLHLISRLCEEEGIYFYFEHTEDSHKLCFCDAAGGPPIAGENDLRFYAGSGQFADTAVISSVTLHERVNSTKASYKEWNFEKPKLNLSVEKEEDSKTPAGMHLEMYRYPHLYQLKKPGERYAELQAKRQVTLNKWIECTSDASRFLPSYTFSIHEHPKKGINAKWWVLSVAHRGVQPGVLEHEAPDRGLRYQSSVVAIPEMTRYISKRTHLKNPIIGTQTAIVTGPEGEEIYPDKYGRVKVQFFWDREGKWDEKTTCWIRVAQGWAGTQYGTMAIPRIGHEVIVSFLEGDPDRPIITGRVYHELNRVPYELPANKTRTVFKSMSTPGKEGEDRGFNELRIEDKKGQEEIYIHAEKDVNAYVKHDWKEHILNDKHETVEKLRYTQIKDEDHLIVHKDSHAEYKTKWLTKAGEEIHVQSGKKIVIEAKAEMTFKVGSSFIKLTPGDVTIVGSVVKLNSGGSAGTGTKIAPKGSEPTDEGSAPKSQAFALLQAAKKGQLFCPVCNS